MARKITGFCVALLLILTSASAARRRLNSISELTNFHQNDHTNILQLLHWFASTVSIDGNNVIRLTFDPNSGDFGSHHYGNFESLLDPLPWGCKYYTVGNVHQTTSKPLPLYVVYSQRGSDGWNRARIIIRVRGGNTGYQNQQIIERVFITQHYATSDGQGTNYNPESTYEVSTSLLREIRRRDVDEIQRLAESSQRGNSGSTYLQGHFFSNQYNYTPQANIRPASDDDRLKTFFIAILLIIFFFVLMSFLGNVKK